MWPTRLECFDGSMGRDVGSICPWWRWCGIGLWLVFCPSYAWSLELEAPASQQVKPGAWLSLAFVVKADDQKRSQALDASVGASVNHHEPQIHLPLGWSLLVPPRKLDLSGHDAQTLTLAVAVPTAAPAGRHQIVLTIGPWSVVAEVVVEADYTIEWLGDSQSDQTIHRWWSDRPWSVDEALVLVGNQALDVRLESKAPLGLKVDLSDKDDRLLVPGVAQMISVEVRRDPIHLRQLPKRLAIAIDVLDANTGERLATRRWVLAPLGDGAGQSLAAPWAMSGFVDWQSSKEHGFVSLIEPHDWGIRGSGQIDQAGSRRLDFAWHQDPRWGRYADFEGTQFRWQVGHRVFLGEQINGLSRSGKGLSVSWENDKAAGAWRMGWIGFKAHGINYQSPWWSRSGWRLAYINASSNHADLRGLGGWWSLAYQSRAGSYRSQSSEPHQWKTHLTGNQDRVASRIEYRYQPQRDAWLGLLAESIPKDHVSGLPAGRRLLIQSRQPLKQEAYLTTSVSVRRQPSMNHTTRQQRAVEIHHWQKISSFGGIRLGLGGTHQRNRRARFNSLEATSTRLFPTDEYALSIRLIGHLGQWHWSGRLDTHGRFGLATRWEQANVGLWRLNFQNTYTQLSLERSGAGPWQWSVALDKRRSWVQPTLWAGRPYGLDENANANDTLATHTNGSGIRLHLNLSRRVGRLHEWSLAVSPATTDLTDTTVWLRYRWRGRASSPMPTITRLLGQEKSHTLSGQVQRLTPAGPMPVEGVIVSLNDRNTQTDARGQYRFFGVGLGLQRLAIEQRFDKKSLNEKSNTKQVGIERGWLLTTNDTVDVWVDSPQPSTSGLGESNQSLTHDWLWVAPGHVLVDVAWPDEDLIDEDIVDDAIKASILEKMRLVGTCDTCPSAQQRRTATRNAQGQWVVTQLLPGRWQWQWVGALLPTGHEFKEPTQSLHLLSGQTARLTWEVRHRPRPIEWQGIQSVELRP